MEETDIRISKSKLSAQGNIGGWGWRGGGVTDWFTKWYSSCYSKGSWEIVSNIGNRGSFRIVIYRN